MMVDELAPPETVEVLGTGGFNSSVSAVMVKSDGKVLVAGNFSSYGGVPVAKGLARLDSKGNLDGTFTSNTRLIFAKSDLYALAVQPDGQILVGGNFVLHGVGNQGWQGLARFSSTGKLDTAFASVLGNGFDSAVLSIAVQSGGGVIAAGNFTSYAGHKVGGVVRFQSDGRWDEGFSTRLGSGVAAKATIKSIAIQPDGKILLAGDFENFSGLKVDGVVRLYSDGSVDTEFMKILGASFFVGFPILDPGDADSEAGLYLSKVLLDHNGRIVLGGEFISYNKSEEIYASKVLRLNPDGQLDLDFIQKSLQYKFNGDVNALLLLSDGRLLVGCSDPFSRLDADGIHEDEFKAIAGHAVGGEIYTLALQADGKYIVGGRFNSFKGIKVGNIVRLNPDGTMDESFVSGSYK